MRAALVLVGVAALAALVSARCPNSCSGHGDCGAYDKCACWANWKGFDCSERVCEYDIAWATDYRQNAHYYAECSGKGSCDRTTGACNCFEGYTGSACQRSVCPNDCSGHGKCRLIAELPNANKAINGAEISTLDNGDQVYLDTEGLTATTLFQYAKWDGDKIQSCVCDGEFYGPDCSQRYCPKGDDPLTTCTANSLNSGTTPPASLIKQIQVLTLSSTSAGASFFSGANGLWTTSSTGAGTAGVFTGDLVLHYTDNNGEVWTTSRIASPAGASIFSQTQADAALSIATALQNIPNFKIPNILVAASSQQSAVAATLGSPAVPALPAGTTNGASSSTASFTFTFTNERNSGENNLLTCDPLPLGCTTVGCSPKYKQPQYSVLTGTGAATGWTIAADSIFDNSNLAGNVDQAQFSVTIALDATSNYPVYCVSWDFSGNAATPPTCLVAPTASNPYSVYTYVPTGKNNAVGSSQNPTTNGAKNSALSATTGVGFNHVPIGYGVYLNLGNSLAGLSVSTSSTLAGSIATVRCTVTEAQAADANYESLECSGRGTCDPSSGTCSCFEGHFGDHCGLQTILV